MDARIMNETEVKYCAKYGSPLTDDQKGTVYALYRAGWTVPMIADDIGKYEHIIQAAVEEYEADPGVIDECARRWQARNHEKGKKIYQYKKKRAEKALSRQQER